MKPVVVAGELNVDLILTGIDSAPVFGGEILARGLCLTPGSSSMICAMGLARLGTLVRFVGRVGDDERGRQCVDALGAADVDVRNVGVDPSLDTGLTVALSGAGDRALVTYPGAIAALRASDVGDDTLRGAMHLHVSSYFLQSALREGLAELIARARHAGLTVSLDPGHDPAGRWDDGLREIVARVDVFLPNEVEALAITGARDVDAALHELAALCPTVAIKTGMRGCLGIEKGGRPLRVPAYAVDAIDTTGAGDSFDAGFLHAWLKRMPLETCLHWGAACGALSTRALGGTPAQARVDDVHALIGGRQ